MRKSGLILVIFLFVFSFVSAVDFRSNVSNVSINDVYSPNEKMSGSFYLNVSNIGANGVFSVNLNNNSVLLRDFLRNNGNSVSCESYNCTNNYRKTNNGETSKTFSLNGVDKTLALYLEDSSVSFSGLSFDLTSDFVSGNIAPLQVTVADEYVWKFTNYSNEFTRQVATGCFDNSVAEYSKAISSTPYCERVSLLDSRVFQLNADLQYVGNNQNLTFTLRDNYNQPLGSCSAGISSSGIISCNLILNEIKSAGDFYVCVQSTSGSDTTVQLKYENSGDKCGWYGNSLSTNSTGDYGLSVSLPKFAAAGNYFSFPTSLSLQTAVNSYIQRRYNSDCSSGCVIPLVFSGVNQQLSLNNISFRYSSSSGVSSSNKIYEVETTLPKINFSGILNLNLANFMVGSSGNKNVSFYLGDSSGVVKLFNKSIVVNPSPTVNFIYPLNPPAGVNVLFYVDVSSKNITSYQWDFGDGQTATSYSEFMVHRYANISNYNLSVRVKDSSNFSTLANFIISTISPRNALNESILAKRTKLTNTISQLSSLNKWYKEVLTQRLGLNNYMTQISQIEVSSANAYTDEDFVNLANQLYSILFPQSIVFPESLSGPFLVDYTKITPSLASAISDEVLNNSNLYKSAIFAWQKEHVSGTFSKEKVSLLMESGQVETIFSAYQVSLNSNEDGYLIIEQDKSSLTFKDSAGVSSATGVTGVRINAGQMQTINFYTNSSAEPLVYVIPLSIKSLPISSNIGICNSNFICEKNLGESSSNCRSDCKPVGLTVLWIIILLIFFLIIYTIVQRWYKFKYEIYLFKDRRDLFNIVQFINNSRLNGLKDSEIYKKLQEKMWNSEQIVYSFKKTDGKNTGMIEIIPIDKIFSAYRKNQAVKTIDQKISPPTNPNFQKPSFQQNSNSKINK